MAGARVGARAQLGQYVRRGQDRSSAGDLGSEISQRAAAQCADQHPVWSKYPSGAFQSVTGNREPMIDETSGPFRLLSGRGDAPVGYSAGTVSARRIGAGGMEGGWNFSPPCSPLRPKKRSNSH
jgi:hypothetical protein